MLRGRFDARIDGKGRLKVPASFRTIIEPLWGGEFFVTSVGGDTVRIYPMPVYATLEQRLAEASTVEPVVSRFRTHLNSYGQSATMDGQGRVLIHPRLRERAAIDGEVTVLGQQTFLELWNAQAFDQQLKDQPLSAADLRELAALGF